MTPKVKIGDYATYEWVKGDPIEGLILDVVEFEPMSSIPHVAYSIEFLVGGQRLWYDVWLGDEDKVKIHG